MSQVRPISPFSPFFGIKQLRLEASDKPRKRWATSWRDARDEIGGGLGSAPGLPWFRRMGLGGRCMLGLACRPSSPVHFGPSEAVTKFGAGIPVAGHARCCCERVCQSPD